MNQPSDASLLIFGSSAAEFQRCSGMNLIKPIVRRLLSPGEIAALRTLQTERAIASYHRSGLRRIRKQSLLRPARLNLGSGRHRKEGFLNVDLFPGGDVTLDLRLGLPFESDCCELIFSEHCFEHIDYPEPISLLFRECLRVLKPGGEFRFSVPGTEWPLTDYREGAEAPYFKACREHGWHPETCTTRLEHINYHFRQGTEHRFAYDLETAEKVLKAAGFIDVRPRAFDPSLDSKHRELGSLFVSARKPASQGTHAEVVG
ncbi:class I SAM-dependent methyltransferase [Paludisphaera borealis]|nr:methyltransferase domain-containing protein [Paludisphaera borealis]